MKHLTLLLAFLPFAAAWAEDPLDELRKAMCKDDYARIEKHGAADVKKVVALAKKFEADERKPLEDMLKALTDPQKAALQKIGELHINLEAQRKTPGAKMDLYYKIDGQLRFLAGGLAGTFEFTKARQKILALATYQCPTGSRPPAVSALHIGECEAKEGKNTYFLPALAHREVAIDLNSIPENDGLRICSLKHIDMGIGLQTSLYASGIQHIQTCSTLDPLTLKITSSTSFLDFKSATASGPQSYARISVRDDERQVLDDLTYRFGNDCRQYVPWDKRMDDAARRYHKDSPEMLQLLEQGKRSRAQ